METLQIRLPQKQLREIDTKVRKGTYRSRSEAIRDYIDRIEFLSLIDEFQKIIEDRGVPKKELLKAAREARSKLYKKYLSG